MKATLRLKLTEYKKLSVAARTTGIKLGEPNQFGSDEFMVEIDSRDPAKFFEAGRLFAVVTGTEYDAADAKKAAAAKAAAEKEKVKK